MPLTVVFAPGVVQIFCWHSRFTHCVDPPPLPFVNVPVLPPEPVPAPAPFAPTLVPELFPPEPSASSEPSQEHPEVAARAPNNEAERKDVSEVERVRMRAPVRGGP